MDLERGDKLQINRDIKKRIIFQKRVNKKRY